MFLLVAVIAASLPSAAAPAMRPPLRGSASASSQATCPKTGNYIAAQPGEKLMPRKLNELPPANLYRAVYRVVGGCEAPVVVKYRVGAH